MTQQVRSNQLSDLSFPPGPSGFGAAVSAFRQLGDGALSRYIETWQTYGDIIYSKWGPMHTYMLANPADIHHVAVKNQKNYLKGVAYDGFRLVVGQGLVTSDGDLWRKQRHLMQPPFTVTATRTFTDMMAEITQQMIDRWDRFADSGAVVSIDDEMMRLTTSVIGRALFDVDLNNELSEVGYAFQEAFAFVPSRSMNPFSLPLALPLPKHRRFKKNMALIEAFVAERIAYQRQQPPSNNLLSQLLHAQNRKTGYRMDPTQLRDEVVTLFFAGFETTARSLTWLWHILSEREDVAQKLSAESDRILNGRRPEIDDLFQLQYTRMVVDEVLRMYPPVAIMPRQNREDDVIGGYHIPAGSLILLMTYLAHQHPAYWDHPEQFDPERFSPEAAGKRPKYAYMPFANGQRICLGNNFALLEMVLACAMASGRFRLRAVQSDIITPTFTGITSPSKPINLKIEHRK